MQHKKILSNPAFTLVELLVVISIVSMLASILMVQVSLAQAKGRDAVRTQQIRQIDLATRMYVETYKKAPLALTGCDIQSSAPVSFPSSCFAVSTATVGPQKDAWDAFKLALKDFIDVPNDPCVGDCLSANQDFPIGYTYVAPLAYQYYCANDGDCTATDQSYQLYAPMERQTAPSGNEGATSGYMSLFEQPTSMTVRVIVRLNGSVLSSTETGTCVATVIYPDNTQNTSGCVRSMVDQAPGAYMVRWEAGYPSGANTSIVPTINPSYPQTLGIHPVGGNPITFYIDFQ